MLPYTNLPQGQDKPLDYSKTSEDASRSTLSRDGFVNSTLEQHRVDMSYSTSTAPGAPLDYASIYNPAPFSAPSPEELIQKSRPLGQLGNQWKYARRYDPLHSTFGDPNCELYRNPAFPITPTSNSLNYMQHRAHRMSNKLNQMQPSAISTNHSSEPSPRNNSFYNTFIPARRSSGHEADPNFKPTGISPKATNSSNVKRKSSKQRPFKAIPDEILNTDFSKEMRCRQELLQYTNALRNGSWFPGSGSTTAPEGVNASPLQPVQIVGYRNTSGPVGNGENSYESMDNTSQGEESSPRTDSSDSAAVGSTQVDEDTQKQESTDNPITPARRKGQPIPEEKKNREYYDKRKRNNIAAKKSRDARKEKEDRLALKVEELAVVKSNMAELENSQEIIIRNMVSEYDKLLAMYSTLYQQTDRMKRVILEMRNASAGCQNCRHVISQCDSMSHWEMLG